MAEQLMLSGGIDEDQLCILDVSKTHLHIGITLLSYSGSYVVIIIFI